MDTPDYVLVDQRELDSGAIGVSGATPEGESDCAVAALASLSC